MKSASVRFFVATLVLSGGLFLLSQVAFSDQSVARWQPTVILMDFDDVISSKQKSGLFEWAPMAKIFFWNPKALSLLRPRNFKQLYQQGLDMKEHTNGASNIIYAVLQDLTAQGYGDMDQYFDEILMRAIKPKPIMAMINHLFELKSRGYMLVGVTNQDYLQASVYRQKLKEIYTVDLDDLFDLIVTTRVNHMEPITGFTDGYYAMDNNVIMLHDPKSYKPNPSYFATVKTVVKKRHPTANNFIMTDDSQENLDGARKAGIDETILFFLPKGSAAKSSGREIKRAVRDWYATIDQKLAVS